jgi:hypothetical protein
MTATIPTQRGSLHADLTAFNALLDEAAALFVRARSDFRLGLLDDVDAAVMLIVDWLGSELVALLGPDAPGLQDMATYRRIGELILAREGIA